MIVHWLELYLRNFFSFSCIYCFLPGGRKGGERIKEYNKNLVSIENGYIERIDNFEDYFCAGGRHQTAVNGEIVQEYLQTCTNSKLLNNEQYFKEKHFEVKGYKPLSSTSKDASEPNVTLFFSKIPLDQLSIYLNLKELRDLAVLHRIHIPYRTKKEERNIFAIITVLSVIFT
jgi:hypothetical protein